MFDTGTGRDPERYWERAGEIGYGRHMFSSRLVEAHINRRLWDTALDIADMLGVNRAGTVLDLGCGDGAFAIQSLAPRYRAVHGYDKSEPAIARAAAAAAAGAANARFAVADLIAMAYAALPAFDAVFMMGFLHHVKAATPAILKQVAGKTDRVVVLEPNGDNLLRRALELTPSYKAAGEDHFTTAGLVELFAVAGFEQVVWRRMNLFPNFTPGPIYRLFAPLEPIVEASAVLRCLCTVNMLGFRKPAVAAKG